MTLYCATMLAAMQEKFGLQYEIVDAAGVNATGSKAHYYYLNTKAADFWYQPVLISLDGVLIESGATLASLMEANL